MIETLLDFNDLRSLFGLSEHKMRDLARRPDFPAAVVLSPRRKRWQPEQVQAFYDSFNSETSPVPRRSDST